MKLLFSILLLACSIACKSQHWVERLHELRASLKPIADSISIVADSFTSVSTLSDTVKVYDIKDIDRFIGFYIEQRDVGPSGFLVKATINDPEGIQFRYYFYQDALVKVTIKRKTGIQTNYYYSPVDNSLEPDIVFRLIRNYPETADFYKQLEIGRSFARKEKD